MAGNPLEGVKIEYTLKDRGNIVENSSYTTSSDGLLSKGLSATMVPYYSYLSYESEFDFKATKDGYYSKSGTMSSDYGGEYSSSNPVEKDKITLIRPIDYFDKKFVSTLSDAKLKTRILNFIDLIILQGLISDTGFGRSILFPLSL